MPNVFEGDGKVGEGRFAIVVSRYNDSITGKLLDGAVRTLEEAGVPDAAIDVAWVPGAWEIPLVATRFAESGDYQAVLCLGAVIRGETTHDQHINRQVSLSLGQLALATKVPVLFGVLTCNTIEQAIHRSGGNVGNKGVECAQAALEMASLLQRLPASQLGEPRPFEIAERRMASAAEPLGQPPRPDLLPRRLPTGQQPSASRQGDRPAGPLRMEDVRRRARAAAAQAAPDQIAAEASLSSPEARMSGPSTTDSLAPGHPEAAPPLPREKPADSPGERKRAARKTRRGRARQIALQVLYEDDLNPQRNLAVSARFLRQRLRHNPELIVFAQQLVAGVRRHRGELDQILTVKLQNWSLNRLAVTDRNVLRLGAYEILFGGTPGPVAINEAVELARRFGSQHSAQFVNGVLDRVFRQPETR